jgi:hypothetical protein
VSSIIDVGSKKAEYHRILLRTTIKEKKNANTDVVHTVGS